MKDQLKNNYKHVKNNAPSNLRVALLFLIVAGGLLPLMKRAEIKKNIVNKRTTETFCSIWLKQRRQQQHQLQRYQQLRRWR